MPIKFDRFCKLMALTTSSMDGEALSALRKANAMLAESNMTWPQLLEGKAKFVREEASGHKTEARKDYEKRSGAKPHRPWPEQKYFYSAEEHGAEINEMFEFLDRNLHPGNSFKTDFVDDVFEYWVQKNQLSEAQYRAIRNACEMRGW